MFQKEGDQFVCCAQGEEIYRTPKIAICFSWDQQALQNDPSYMPTIHKHGHPVFVNRWVWVSKRKYREAGLHKMASDLFVIESSDWDLEDLRKIFEITGYLGVFLKEHPELMPRPLVD